MYRSAESLYCIAETNTPLYINCTRIKIFKKRKENGGQPEEIPTGI